MKKRSFALLLSLSLAFAVSAGGLCSGDTASAAACTAFSLCDYSDGEVFVEYEDGGTAVLSFSDEESLKSGLAALSEDNTVLRFQPNVSYETTALSVSDALVSQQWALYNDGSFVMKERENRYPVYDQPFETPSAPGRWNMPGDKQTLRRFSAGTSLSAAGITAVSGIDIGAEEAWSLSSDSGREVVVALIDTGIDSSHEDLQNILWTNEDEIAGNGIDDDGNGYIDDVNGWNFYNNNSKTFVSSAEDSHGTHCAGTVLANADNGIGITGIVRSDTVKIMSLKALGGSGGSGTTASVIEAIRYAEANGASICNLSFGSTTNDPALYQAIAESDMLFIVAAGNNGTDTDRTPCYPASYDLDNIISVANLNADGTLHFSSNYGAASVDLAAPGSYILSTTPGSGYSYMTGTSMAAPMVTAAAAMLYSERSDLTLADVKDILLSSVRKLDSLSGSVSSGGMLNLAAAMRYDTETLSHRAWSRPESETAGDTSEAAAPQTQPDAGSRLPAAQPAFRFTQPALRVDFGFLLRSFF